MAVTTLSQALHDWWVGQRPAVDVGAVEGGTLRSALVSDLTVGDFILGGRILVTSVGATTSGNRAFTGKRRLEADTPYSWPAAATVWIIR